MDKGKNTCKILKEIRRQIAEANDIEFITSECRYQGDCLGTCPKCEAEVRYLEQQLEKKRLAGKAATIIGVSMGITSLASTAMLTSCNQNPQKAPVENIDSTNHDIIFGEDFGDTIVPPDMIPVIERDTDRIVISGEMPITVTEETSHVDSEQVYNVAEEMPNYPGGFIECSNFLDEHIKYPATAKESGTHGRVVLQFIVEKDGSLSQIEVVRNVDPDLDKEAVRVVKSMPKWIPGKQNGETVRVKFTLPITFKPQ